jgi:hypothetical protein
LFPSASFGGQRFAPAERAAWRDESSFIVVD